MRPTYPQAPASDQGGFPRVRSAATRQPAPGRSRTWCGFVCLLAACLGAKAAEIAPERVVRRFGPIGRYSDRTITVAVEADRSSARVIAYAIKDRPFFYSPDHTAQRVRGGGSSVELAVALLGPDDRRFTRPVEIRGLCFDHDPAAEAHIEGDTIRLHRETFLVDLPALAGFERVEIVRPVLREGATVSELLGSQRLTPDLLMAGGGILREPGIDSRSTPGNGPALSPETTGAVHWPSEYGDPDVYTVYGDEADAGLRINIVVVPDGYTYAEKATLEAHAQALISTFRARTPYKEHDPFINYILVYAYSTESGTDQCDCSVVRDTAMNTRFPRVTASCGNPDNRCLYYGASDGGPICDPMSSSANIVAAELRAPIHDTTIIMVNTTRYGGCGGLRAVYSAANGSATEIAVHELGHSLAGLGDEYESYAGCGTQERGVNTSLNPIMGSWPEWIADIGPPVEGAAYYTRCLYRPEYSCEMRSLGQSFCRVCQQQWALTYFGYPRIYGLAPISSVSPEGDPTTQVGLPVSFSVETRLAVGPNVTNQITWQISGPGFPEPTTVATQVNAHTRSFSTPGSYALTCDAVADTNFIKPERTGVNHSYNTWFVDAVPVPEVSGLADPQIVVLKNGTNADIRFADTGSTHYNLYVSKAATTHPLGVASPASGKKQCGLSGLVPVAGGMKELRGYDLGAGLSGPATVLYFLVTADNGPGTEGSLGEDSNGAERTADSYCQR